jgi:hypothetical protein
MLMHSLRVAEATTVGALAASGMRVMPNDRWLCTEVPPGGGRWCVQVQVQAGALSAKGREDMLLEIVVIVLWVRVQGFSVFFPARSN